ncbi:uncharacterized protein B0H64DRAFT_241294 [Chaetomium fimeti]|uniref:Uncharacterized protein n=1 Tax=Chaetomium fimeti TaxID=1854472 RepID=A0AAE0H8A3_9PEZI|nr:hypothetical protein B0H64DRAFT_241294 [Chaetomium fimeti]
MEPTAQSTPLISTSLTTPWCPPPPQDKAAAPDSLTRRRRLLQFEAISQPSSHAPQPWHSSYTAIVLEPFPGHCSLVCQRRRESRSSFWRRVCRDRTGSACYRLSVSETWRLEERPASTGTSWTKKPNSMLIYRPWKLRVLDCENKTKATIKPKETAFTPLLFFFPLSFLAFLSSSAFFWPEAARLLPLKIGVMLRAMVK